MTHYRIRKIVVDVYWYIKGKEGGGAVYPSSDFSDAVTVWRKVALNGRNR